MPDPFYTWRNGEAYAGQTIYFWSPTGQLPTDIGDYEDVDTDNLELVFPTRLRQWPNSWVMGVKVKYGAATGQYSFHWTDPNDPMNELYLRINVVDPPPSPDSMNSIVIPLSGGRAAIQAAIDDGYRYIFLSPGDYQIDETLTFDPETAAPAVVIDGRGWASMTVLPTAIIINNWDHPKAFEAIWPLTLRGITFRTVPLPPTVGETSISFPPVVLHTPYTAAVDIDVIDCRLEDMALGAGYTTVDTIEIEGNAYSVGGALVERCEFVRATTFAIPPGMVMNQCLLREASPLFDQPFLNANAGPCLVINSDWVRTARGIVCQTYTVQNGVVAACRFFDIAHGAENAGEVILFEGYPATDMSNNAVVSCDMYGCSGSGIQLAGGNIHHNYFGYIFADTRTYSVFFSASYTSIHDNVVEHVEMGAELFVTGHCSDNRFNDIVALRYPLRGGNESPGLGYLMYGTAGKPPFVDTSTFVAEAEEGPNEYKELYLSHPDMPVRLFTFASVTYNSTPP